MDYVNKDYYNSIEKRERRFINSSQAKSEQFIAALEKENIPFSAAISAYKTTFTVSVEYYERAKNIHDSIQVPVQTRQNEIIGNTDYRSIKNKNYISTDEHTARELAKLLAGNTDIRFSGVIRSDGSAVITADGEKNAVNIRRIINNIENSELYEALKNMGFSRAADSKNGFINIVNDKTGEAVGFENADSLRAAITDSAYSSFFHPEDFGSEKKEEIADNIPNEDHFILRQDQTAVDWIYYNPDGNNGEGQFVETTLYADDMLRAYNARISAETPEQGREAFLNSIIDVHREERLIDSGTEPFVEYMNDFLDFKESDSAIISKGVPSDDIIARLENNFPEVQKEKMPLENSPAGNSDVIGSDSDNNQLSYSEQLIELTDKITKKQAEFTGFISAGNYDMASSAAAELAEMSRRAEEIKAAIQKEAITVDDVQALRSIEPKRKSVQNMLENEVAQTPKFEKLLNEEMGKKSAYEMRSGNNEWRNDETKTVPIINVQKREIPKKLAEVRKQNDIPRGTFINKDTGIEIQFGRKSIEEIIAKAIPDAKRDIPVEARIASLYQMQELIENSVCFDSQISDYDPVTSKNKSPNSLFIHRMHGVLEYEGKNYLANLSIEESYDKSPDDRIKRTYNRVYSFRDIEITPVELLGEKTHADLQNASEDTPSSVTTITIPQLYELVKTYDQRFFENPNAIGRVEREAEIKAQEEYNNAVVKFKEHKNELSTRVNDEYRNFINGLKMETPDVLVESAAEIADKEKIRQYLEDYTPTLSDEQYEALLSRSNPLDEIYEQWVKNGELNSLEDVSIALEETADRILISLERENARSEAVPEVIKEEINETKDIDETDDIKEALDLDNNTITFSVVTIEGEKPLVIGSYIDEEDITALEEYQDYIYDTGRKNIDVTVDYYTIGMGDNESYGADTDEKDYISEHLDEVLKSKYTDRLESETYFIATPAELLEEISGEAEEKNYLFTVVEFEDRSRYILPGEIGDNNIKDTEAWKEVKQNNFDIDSIADLDEDIRVTYTVYQTGSGEAVIPTADEISEIKDNIDEVMSNTSPVSSDDSSVRPWADVDDVIFQMEEVWKERHEKGKNVSDGFDNSNFLYPKNLMRTAHDSEGKDHYNLDDSIVQIKLSGSEWLHPVDAAVEMNRRGVNIDDIEMLSVRYVSSDGTIGEKDLTPEQYIVYRSHTEERTTAFLAAVNAAEERKRVPEEMMNIIYNDMPSFVKSAVAWDELMEYDGIYDRLNKGEDPIEVAKSYLANQGTLSWNTEELKDGYFTWSVKDKGATADISVSVNDNITFREMYNSHIEVSWADIADAFKKRIEQELNYNKLSDKTINVTAVGEDRFRFVDSSSGIETVESREDLTARFANMFNKSELNGIIKSVIENAPYEKQDISADNSIENETSDNSPQGNSEPTYTNVFEWKEIPESIDADTGKPTLWSTEISSESYGRFLWISMKDEHSFDIEYAHGDKFLPVSENSTGFYSMADAAEWAENNLTDILSAHKKEQQEEIEQSDELSDLIHAKNLEAIQNIEIGDEITLHGETFIISSINDSFMMSMDKKSPDVSGMDTISRQFMGNWKNQLADEAGNEPIVVVKANAVKDIENTVSSENGTYTIYQIPSGDRYRDIRFLDYEKLGLMGQLPDRLNYAEVYTGKLNDIKEENKLDGIFVKFNMQRPDDFEGRSLSVSDVVVIENDEGKKAYFVDDIGYKDITDIFLDLDRKEHTAEKLNIYDYENIRLVSRSEWNDRTLGDDENPAFEEIAVSCTPNEDGSFTKYAYNTTNSNSVDVWEEENSISGDEMLEDIANHLKNMGQDNGNRSYHIELTDHDGNMRTLDNSNFEFYQDKSSFALDRAKNYIKEFLDSEYSSTADFSDMEHISIGYTEIGSEEQGDHSLQMEADLVNYAVNYYIDDELAKTEKYDTLEQMNRDHLSVLSFEDMLYVGTTELDRILEYKKKSEQIKSQMKELGIPYSDKPFDPNEQVDVFTYDGSMSIEDFRKWQSLNSEKVEAEQKADRSEPINKKSGSEIEVGDRFLYNDREYTVTSEKGIYPDDVGVSYEENTGGISYQTTQNIDRYKLADNAIFLGNPTKEQQKENSPQGNPKAEKEKSSEKSFSEQVDEVLNGTADRYNDLKVCDTPQILIDVGCEKLPMFYTKKHLRDALKPKGNSGESIHYHGLDKEQIKKMPDLLSEPVLIYDSLSSSRNDSIVVVTSELDKDDLPIIAAIRPNGKAKYDLEIINSNFVLSFHGREHFDNQLTRAFDEDKILYINKQKSQELFSVLGLQLSEGLNNLDSNVIIHQSRNIVNTQNEISSQKTVTEPQTENSPQGNPKAEKEKSSEKSFSEQVDEVLNGTARRYKSDLMVCNTPEILLKAGCRQLPMMYTRKHLLDAVHNKSKKNPHFHGIAPDLIKRIPELIQSPVMVFDSISEKNSDSIVMVLDAFDNDKNPLIMSVKPNGQGVYELKHIEANFITSIYGKDRNFAKYIERVTESNSMIFWDKNKSQELFRVLQLQLPQGVNNLDSNVIIHQSRNIVNTQNEISSQKTVTEPQTENSPQGNSGYNPKVNDIIEYQEQLYRISDITGEHITLEEADNLIPKTRFMSLSSLLGSDFSVIEESKETAVEKPAEEIPVQPQKTEPEKEKISEAMQAHPAKTEAPKNFIITDENFGVSGGAKARYENNIAAIKTLKAIEAEKRTATPDEQQILSKYTGWGAIPQAFDSSNDKWDKEYTELKELLTPDEYKAARESTMNAHYTSPTVISAIYDGLKNLGFENGKILEPAMGIGNFFGVMPESMRGSELHGVELDSLTGRIAQQLYPNAEIKIKGYESTYFPDNSFDVAVGNVPFGSYKLNDDRYNDNKFLIHDYFFAKTLDKVRPGGIIAFVTSKGTMDKENSDVRKYIAERAELLGAIRLPNNAFEANAGTEVTSDIIFLQKRETPIEIDPDKVEWLNKAENPDGLSINNYFVQHPEMVLGEIVEGNKLYGRQTNDTTCIPIEGTDLKQQLAEAVQNIKGTYTAREADKTQENSADIIEAPENMPKFSYAVVDNKLYFHESGPEMYAVKASKDRIERAAAMIELRTVVKELLDLQSENINGKNDNDISDKRKELNARYDSFTEKYGNISDKKNAQVLKGDAGYTLVSELEVKDEQGNVTGKADIFTKNTVRPNTVITHADSPEEALIISVAEKGKVDFDCMTEITGMSKESLISALTETGQIYRLPQPEEKYVTADEYLTGNIRIKLEQARNAPEGYDYSRNIAALESAMPKPLRPQDITAKLGSHWIAPEYIRQFILEKIQPPFYSIGSVQVEYSSVAGVWKVSADASAKNSRGATKIYGTDRMHAFEIIDKILNNGTLQVKDRKTDENGDYIRDQNDNYVLVVNEEETKAVKVAADKIKSDFQDWIFNDPERRDILVQKYNDMYNSIRQREYDGSHLSFAGMNPAIELKEHQKNAVARALYGGNTLLAHAVGAGKTFEMIAIAMEGKRLGLHNKAMIAVPNALTEQEGADFRKLYPNAKVLVATEKDFEKKNRQKLFSKIANNDWDAVIVGHSQFDRIGISKEREAAYINKELDDMREALAKAKQSAVNPKQSFSVKAIERTIKSYETRLQSILDAQEKEDFIDFEELGCDKLFIDESHLYKNLATATKMSNIAGVSTNGSQRAAQLLMKCKYLDELTDHKGVIFASGTPVSNSMTEMYTLMRYLQSDVLEDAGIKHFDEWAADFGEVKTDFELKPESDGKYQMKTRFAHFTNVPELMNMFKECADIRTADTLNLEGKPNAHVHDIVAQPSKAQKKFVKNLGKRAEKIRSGNVDPRKDNMLCITNDGRKIGLDERLIDPNMPDNPGSKVNLCVQNVLDIYNRTSEQRSTQCIFCDMSTPKSEARQDKFIVYRPSTENESGFEIARKKVGLGKLNDFDSIKTYINKNSTEEADKLHEGDIVVIRRPDENMENILSEAAVYKDGKLIPGGEELLNTVTLSAIEPMPPKEFNVYDDIKDKLIAQGVPEKEIAFIHDYQTADEKQQLFKQMNAGDVRILLGSTQKCGAGMNAQRRMIALHHLDAPLRPSDMEQRNGRIDRQGNENKDVDIYRYVTDKTFDAYLYQILENKQKFISQVMTSKTPERVCADIDEQALDYAEVKSLCAGNPLIKEQMLLTAEIRDLKMEKGRFNEQIYDMQDKIRTVYPNKIKENNVILKRHRTDYELAQNAKKIITEDGKTAYPITVCGQTYTDKKEGGAALAAAAKDNISKLIDGKTIEVGEYRGMKISIFYDSMMNKTKCDLCGEKHHYLELNPDTDKGNVIRMDNCIANIEKMCRDLENENNVLKSDLENMKVDVMKPFPKAEQLAAAEERLTVVLDELTRFSITDNSAAKDLYERLCETFPDIMNGNAEHERYTAGECFDPLVVEMHEDMLYMAHTHIQNGDVMNDPLIVFQIKDEAAVPICFENSGMGIYEEHRTDEMTESAASWRSDVLDFTDEWLDNIEQQGYSMEKPEMQAEKTEKSYSYDR